MGGSLSLPRIILKEGRVRYRKERRAGLCSQTRSSSLNQRKRLQEGGSTLQCGSVKSGVMCNVPSAMAFGMSACSSQKLAGPMPETPLCLLSLRNEIPGVTSLNSSTV